VSVRRRAYPEVLETLLTSLTGGVAAETHPFPPAGAEATPPVTMPLLDTNATHLVAVYGTRNGRSHRFRKGSDVDLDPDGGALVWPAGAELPDVGTTVQVSYYVEGRTSVVSDIETGSVVRTLAEAVALEIAGLYAQLDAVYESAFIETASGRALEHVVALLGIERVEGGRGVTKVEFNRAAGSRGAISIPAGTRVMDPAGTVEYETLDSVTLSPEARTIRVEARDVESNAPVPADTLSVLPVPIAGIARVTNPAPARVATTAETDAELRARAKSFLHGSERATLGALRHAIAWHGGGMTADIEEDPDLPGRVAIRPHVEALSPAMEQRLLAAIEEARPAGVLVRLLDERPPGRIDLSLRLSTTDTLLEEEVRGAHDEVRRAVGRYFEKLPAREDGSTSRLVGAIMAVDGVEDVRLLDVVMDGVSVLDGGAGILRLGGAPTVLGELRIADTNVPTRVLLLVTHPVGTEAPAVADMRSALDAAIAYLNDRNAREVEAGAADEARRALSYGRLLHALPLPGKPAGSLAAFDAAASAGGAPDLPDASSIQPYRASFVLTQSTGMSVWLAEAGQAYELVPYERLSLAGVDLEPEA